MSRRLTDQQLRELLTAALDERTPLVDRRNKAIREAQRHRGDPPSDRIR